MRRVIIAALLLAACMTILAGCVAAETGTTGNGDQNRQKLAAPTGTPLQPKGITALQVRPNEQQPFTVDDVGVYFQTHVLPGAYGTTSVTVVSLEFITSREVSAHLQGETTGFPDAYVLGFAILAGDFVFSSPPQGQVVYHAKRAYAAFDAKTGNLVMDGTYSEQ